MKHVKLFFLLITFFYSCSLWSVSPGNKRNNLNSIQQKEYLFPGTGFFKRNRDPIDDQKAQKIFLDAEKAAVNGDTNKALDLFENFAKRRSDMRFKHKNIVIQVGPESLYRAALIREQKGDWQKAFEHLRLIAKAYTEYDFERVAESLMRIAERLAMEKLPRKWGVFQDFDLGVKT